MEKYLVCLIIAVLCFNSGCKKKGSVLITQIATYGAYTNIGQGTSFYSITKDATHFLWNFGDGDTSMRPSVTHVYQDTGTYTVSFVPSNAYGSGNKTTFKVTITNTGWWIFKSMKGYLSGAGGGYDSQAWMYYSSSTSPDTSATLKFTFYDTLPNNPGAYIVTNGNLTSPNQVSITFQMSSYMSTPFFQSTGGNGDQKINLYVNNGAISIIGSGIELANTSNPSDSASISFDMER